jgi:hypothetical protein
MQYPGQRPQNQYHSEKVKATQKKSSTFEAYPAARKGEISYLRQKVNKKYA